ncbi:MAG: hypothetical protein MJE68_01920 [Proteobacteria bacterium]|nr:hypothetical protein [Pseudomonadota bacterium]
MAETVYAFPFPVLEEGNTSFPNATYDVEWKKTSDESSVMLTHKLEGAPFLQKLLDKGQASYACLVAIPVTGYRRFHTSKNSQQKITWDKGYMADSFMIRPFVIATKNITHTLGKNDGVADIWHGQEITIPQGARLARYSYLRHAASKVNLLRFKLNDKLDATAMQVEATTDNGLIFNVSMGKDLHRFMQNRDEKNKLIHNNICVHAVSRALEIIKSEYTGKESDGNQIWEGYSNLRMLADALQEEDLPMWDEEGFDPVKVATILYPIIVPKDVMINEEDEE